MTQNPQREPEVIEGDKVGLLPACTLSRPSRTPRLCLYVALDPTTGPGSPCRLPSSSYLKPTLDPPSTSPIPQERARDQMLLGAMTQVHSQVSHFSFLVMPSSVTNACLQKPPSKVTEPFTQSTCKR